MTARSDLANIAADRASSVPCAEVAQAVLDALDAHPDLVVGWLQETGVLEQVGWVAPDRVDGTINGKWWYFGDGRPRNHGVPVFRVVDRPDTP